jgi:peptidoglycan/xylan/chitin deacetylase (PgdA/CDA1 family)
MGKTRQQVLLASLVAAGLLLLALPTGRAVTGIDAVDAAAQRAIGTHSEKSKKDAKQTTGQPDAKTGGGQDDQATPAKPATAPAQPGAVPSGGAKHDARATGPGSSLRTTGSKAIALTFDDGPDPVQTPKILAMLDMYDIKATFCLVGEQVRKHPEVVQQIVAAGHTLCNHTWNHSLTIGKDKPEEIQADLARTSAAIEAAVPGAKVPFFRAPGGNFTDRLVSVAGGAGMTSLYWEVDPQDWDHPEGETDPAHVARVVADIKKHTRPGAIILSHDFNQPDTIAAYSKLLPWLTQNFTIGIPGQPGATPSTPPASEPTTPDPGASAGPGATPAPTGGAVDPAAQSAG